MATAEHLLFVHTAPHLLAACSATLRCGADNGTARLLRLHAHTRLPLEGVAPSSRCDLMLGALGSRCGVSVTPARLSFLALPASAGSVIVGHVFAAPAPVFRADALLLLLLLAVVGTCVRLLLRAAKASVLRPLYHRAPQSLCTIVTSVETSPSAIKGSSDDASSSGKRLGGTPPPEDGASYGAVDSDDDDDAEELFRGALTATMRPVLASAAAAAGMRIVAAGRGGGGFTIVGNALWTHGDGGRRQAAASAVAAVIDVAPQELQHRLFTADWGGIHGARSATFANRSRRSSSSHCTHALKRALVPPHSRSLVAVRPRLPRVVSQAAPLVGGADCVFEPLLTRASPLEMVGCCAPLVAEVSIGVGGLLPPFPLPQLPQAPTRSLPLQSPSFLLQLASLALRPPASDPVVCALPDPETTTTSAAVAATLTVETPRSYPEVSFVPLPPTITAAGMTAEAAAPVIVTPAVEEASARFLKLMRMGVPRSAIEAKAQAEGMLDAFLHATGGAPPPVSSSAMSVHGSVGIASSVSVSTPVAVLPFPPALATNLLGLDRGLAAALEALYAPTILSKSTRVGSVNSSSGVSDAGPSLSSSLHCVPTGAVAVTGAPPQPAPLLSHKRSMQVGIALARFKAVPRPVLATALLTLCPSGGGGSSESKLWALTLQQAALLPDLAPTPTEQAGAVAWAKYQLRAAEGGASAEAMKAIGAALGEAGLFVLEMSALVGSQWRERASALAFRVSYSTRHSEAASRVLLLATAAGELASCTQLRIIVAAAADLASRMPSVPPPSASTQSPPPSAAAFISITTLRDLSTSRVQGVAMRDARGTMLHVLATMLARSGEEDARDAAVFSPTAALPAVVTASREEWGSLGGDIAALEAGARSFLALSGGGGEGGGAQQSLQLVGASSSAVVIDAHMPPNAAGTTMLAAAAGLLAAHRVALAAYTSAWRSLCHPISSIASSMTAGGIGKAPPSAPSPETAFCAVIDFATALRKARAELGSV